MASKRSNFWYGIPTTLGSDIGPAFAAEKVQLVARVLKITWKLHTNP